MDKRKGKKKGKGEEAKFATADGQPLPVKRPRSTSNQGVPSNLSDSFANRRHEIIWNVTNATRNLIP